MAVLGIWLSKTTISMGDFRLELRPFFTRLVVFAVLVSLLLLIANQFNASLITQNPATLYLLCLLPPAANIIVLETHYLGTGNSARAISCGTCISIVVIALYSAAVLCGRALGIWG